MKKRFTLLFIILCSILFSISLLGGCSSGSPQENDTNNKKNTKVEAEVRNVVEGFGSVLQKVSLQGPAEEVKKSIQENYSKYVTPDLLERWLENPLKAPGRLTSSPWPDRIEIKNVERLADEAYKVEGELIEVISAEKKNEVAVRKPITLVVENTNGKWLILTVRIDDPVEQ